MNPHMLDGSFTQRRITKEVRQESDGTWSALVWEGAGTLGNPIRNIQRFYGYKTRAEARKADISVHPKA